MAIVINGSGTVTGLAVGGLPDGTVDAGTLATNSVDSAELIDGAVDDSHIAALAASKLTGALPAISGASLTGLTSSQMPTGSVLQVVQATHSSQVSTSSTSWTNMGLSASITPTTSSSKVLVILNYVGAVTSDNHLYIQILRDSTSILSNGSARFAQSAGVSGGGLTLNKLDSPSTTSAVTYSGQFHTRDSGENVIVQYGNTPSTITLLEVAG